MARIRLGALLALSTLATVVAVVNAFYQKHQFYLAMVYLCKSNTNLGILYIECTIVFVVVNRVLKQLLFGELRAVEVEHLMDRTWYATTETCLAFTMFRDDFHPRFIAMFLLLLVVKCGHWLADDRVSYAEQVPVLPRLFHYRQTAVLLALVHVDALIALLSYRMTLAHGPSVQVVFGFEYAILFVAALATSAKYAMFLVDSWRTAAAAATMANDDNNNNAPTPPPWEEKATYQLYVDFCAAFLRVVAYTFFIVAMIRLYTLPLFTIRPYYLALRALRKSLHDILMARRALINLNIMYPSVTAAELSQCSDTTCIICREDMAANANAPPNSPLEQIRRLPCNHIFHRSCLHAWFQRQQTCPTCRADVLQHANNQPNNQNNARGSAHRKHFSGTDPRTTRDLGRQTTSPKGTFPD